MAHPSLTPSLANVRADRVKAVRALSGRSARLRHGQFLVEGPQGVREAVRHAAPSVRDIYLSVPAAERYTEIVAAAQQGGIPLHLGTPDVVEAMSSNAQGVLAVVRRDLVEHPLSHALARICSGAVPAPGTHGGRLAVILAHVRDPGNAGTVIRTADAAGAGIVVLAGDTVAPDNPKLVRATAGSLFHLPVVHHSDLTEVIGAVRRAGFAILAADGTGDLDLDRLADTAGCSAPVDLTRPTAWLFGNEAWGLPVSDRALADAVVRVPIHGMAESLNLATASAVCLYASARAQRAPRTVPGDVTSLT